jgi:hypothetical protein
MNIRPRTWPARRRQAQANKAARAKLHVTRLLGSGTDEFSRNWKHRPECRATRRAAW